MDGEYILCISGSVRKESRTVHFLSILKNVFPKYNLQIRTLDDISLFQPELTTVSIPHAVNEFIAEIEGAAGIFIATPEYIHNIPAVLKSALEWLTASGVLSNKKIAAVTFTPSAPRGKYAMTSLLQSLAALGANIICKESFYHNILINNQIREISKMEILEAMLRMLASSQE